MRLQALLTSIALPCLQASGCSVCAIINPLRISAPQANLGATVFARFADIQGAKGRKTSFSSRAPREIPDKPHFQSLGRGLYAAMALHASGNNGYFVKFLIMKFHEANRILRHLQALTSEHYAQGLFGRQLFNAIYSPRIHIVFKSYFIIDFFGCSIRPRIKM